MFGDMLGNFQEKQEKMKEALTAITVEAQAGDGAVIIQANAAREILNIAINKEKISLGNTEELEDLLVVAMNRVIGLASEKEAEESQKMVSNILPPGMEGLTDMFK